MRFNSICSQQAPCHRVMPTREERPATQSAALPGAGHAAIGPIRLSYTPAPMP